jgi:hypothetical protein
MPSRAASRPTKLAGHHEVKQIDEDAMTDVKAGRSTESPVADRTIAHV